MHATGKRDLPITTKLKLVEMFAFLQQDNNKTNQNFEDNKAQDYKIFKLFASQQHLVVLQSELQLKYEILRGEEEILNKKIEVCF